ncbi:MAG: hypothetical protein ABII79_11255 [bacterium]
MSQRFQRRLTELEDNLQVGGDREQFERDRRFFYNLQNLSNLAIIILMRATVDEMEVPEWLAAEVLKPIPPDAPKELVLEATKRAEGIESLHGADQDQLISEIDQVIDFYAERSRQTMGSLADVQAYLEDQSIPALV